MTISAVELSDRSGPRYRAIADALDAEIASGELLPGTRLPTHRDLAWRLGVTVGTVTRAYNELWQRGLVQGEVGRGTFVRGGAPDDLGVATDASGLVEMSLNYPAPGGEQAALGPTLQAMAKDPGLGRLLAYQEHAGCPEHRAAGADWIARGGFTVSPERVLVTNGGQHGVLTALAAACLPGDRVATEALAYPGLRAAARMLGLRLDPVALDQDGLVPEAVEAACRSGVRVVCCVPNLQNPTASVMPPVRRQALADIARRHDAIIIEDDIFGFLLPNPPPPVASLAPDNTLYITSLSKTVAPGLRVGYVAVPAAFMDRARQAVRASAWMTPPLMAEIATRWIADGTADQILSGHRAEAAARLTLARGALGEWLQNVSEGALHVWLELPTPWRADDFVAAARVRGVLLATQAPFALGAGAPEAVRVCLGPPVNRETVADALERLAGLLRAGPGRATAPPLNLSIV